MGNHLSNTEKKAKSMREKLFLGIAIIGSVMGVLGLVSKFM